MLSSIGRDLEIRSSAPHEHIPTPKSLLRLAFVRYLILPSKIVCIENGRVSDVKYLTTTNATQLGCPAPSYYMTVNI